MNIFRTMNSYKNLIQDGIAQSVDAIESIHLTLSDVVLGRDGLSVERKLHNSQVTGVYQVVRELNQQVGVSASVLLGSLEAS